MACGVRSSVLWLLAACACRTVPSAASPAGPLVDSGAKPPAPASTASAAPVVIGSTAAVGPPVAAPLPGVPMETSVVATAKSVASWASCLKAHRATKKDVSRDVMAVARACEGVTKMKPVGKTITGKEADVDKPQRVMFEAKAHHCYRVYAQASEGIKDIDVTLTDSAGIAVGQGVTEDGAAVTPGDGAVCFAQDDAAAVVVSVGMGRGEYALQICSD